MPNASILDKIDLGQIILAWLLTDRRATSNSSDC